MAFPDNSGGRLQRQCRRPWFDLNRECKISRATGRTAKSLHCGFTDAPPVMMPSTPGGQLSIESLPNPGRYLVTTGVTWRLTGPPPASVCVSQGPLVLQNTQCIPEGLESYYAEQDSNAREKFYTVINHYNLAKQSITRSVSPWMSVLSEEKLSEQETEAAEKSA